MWEFDCEESWVPKSWCFWTVVLEKTLESPLDCKEIQSVHSKGDQSWVFVGRTDAEAETPILWPPHVKSWLIGKDSDAGRDWGQEEKGMTEDEMAEWHPRLDGHEFEWTPGVSDGQGGLACCDSWGCRVGHDWATELNWFVFVFCFYIFLFLPLVAAFMWKAAFMLSFIAMVWLVTFLYVFPTSQTVELWSRDRDSFWSVKSPDLQGLEEPCPLKVL